MEDEGYANKKKYTDLMKEEIEQYQNKRDLLMSYSAQEVQDEIRWLEGQIKALKETINNIFPINKDGIDFQE